MDATVIAPTSGLTSGVICVQTQYARQFIDLTDQVCEQLEASGIHNGAIIVASQHTTAAIVINEHEPELLKDLDAFLCRIAPTEVEYAHNAVPCPPSEQPNGHSHCQGLVLPTSVTLPVLDGKPMLGRFQRVFLVELDCARHRRISLMVLGI